jgi:hypothetical protein
VERAFPNYGLGSSARTRDLNKASHAAEQLQAGAIGKTVAIPSPNGKIHMFILGTDGKGLYRGAISSSRSVKRLLFVEKWGRTFARFNDPRWVVFENELPKTATSKTQRF